MNKTVIKNLNTKISNLVKWDNFFTYSHDGENNIIVSYKGNEVQIFARTHHLANVKRVLTKLKVNLSSTESIKAESSKSIKNDVEVSKGHPHAKDMMAYALDAAKNDKPWKLWEFSSGTQYNLCAGPLSFNHRYKYRRIMATAICNGVKIPAPLKEELVSGQIIYIPAPHHEVKYVTMYWIKNRQCKQLQYLNLVHENKDAAIQHANAMLILK